MKSVLLAGLAAALFAVPAMALSPVNSGLKPGEKVSPFHPKHVSGPLADSTKCFPCTYQARPQIQVWVNGDSQENVVAIAKSLQANIDKHQGKELKAMIVMVGMSTDCQACAGEAKMVAEKSGVKDVAIAVIGKNDESVKAYKINLDKSVKNTVLAYKDWTVAANMTNVEGAKVSETIDKMVAKVAN
ncbi:MAG: hypothetical protein KIT11_07065 [Fimbriimonadaceae bacterium]|nr:hypothetical protein [Fimbriimonadaceae bacterium]QYK56111.1 MAG: hypothetical protein KF733_01255 [Fimbriimonadaceae bacterium]